MAERGVSTDGLISLIINGEIIEDYRAGILEVKPIAAAEIDSKQSA